MNSFNLVKKICSQKDLIKGFPVKGQDYNMEPSVITIIFLWTLVYVSLLLHESSEFNDSASKAQKLDCS